MAYASGTYALVKLESLGEGAQCQCGYTRTDVPRSASCRCKYQAQLVVATKYPRMYHLTKILQQQKYDLVCALVERTHWPRHSLRQAVQDAARALYERNPDSPTYPVGQLAAVLARRCPGVCLHRSSIVRFIVDESYAFLDPQSVGDVEKCVFPVFVNMVQQEAEREASLAREMASICVGPHVHPSADIHILRTDFVGPTIYSTFCTGITQRPIADLRQLFFAVYLGTEALRELRLRHNDLSTENVCLKMEEEHIMSGGMTWNFAFRLRFIDCGMSRKLDDEPVVDDNLLLIRPHKLAALGIRNGMSMREHMRVCYDRAGDLTGFHLRTVPWLCEHPFIDAMQFLTQMSFYICGDVEPEHRACLDELIDLLDHPDFESRPLRTRLACAAKCCGVPLPSGVTEASAVTDRDRMIASSMRRARSAERGDELRDARAAKRQRIPDDT